MKRTFIFNTVLMIGTLMLTGCQHRNWESFDQHEDEFSARRLYQPLVSGQKELLERMPSVLGEPIVFSLDHFPLRRIEDKIDQSQYWDENKAVFFDIDKTPYDGVHEWVWFNPRRLRVEHVHFDEDGLFSIYRSLPNGSRDPVRKRDMDIFKISFHLIPCIYEDDDSNDAIHEETLGYHSLEQLTHTDSPEMTPVFTDDGNMMVYLATRDDDRHEIMVKYLYSDDHEVNTVSLFPTQYFDVRYPWMLSDGRLTFAANIDGHYRMYQVENFQNWDGKQLKPHKLQPLQYPLPKNEEDNKYIFGNMGVDGVPMPVLLKLPETYDLPTLLSLLEVYNPRVNEKRALLAAALIEAKLPKLNNWPILSMGLGYEEAVDIFFDLPQLAAGDTLSREVINMLIGFSQPLIGFRRNAALSEAGMWQARIAADLVDNELNERFAEAAEVYFEAVYLERYLAIQDELIKANDEKSRFFMTLREQGEAIRLQLMAVEQNRSGQLSGQKFSAERLAFLKSRLKEVCGIPETVNLKLGMEQYRLASFEVPSLDELQDVAQLNHPRINIVRHQLSRSFYLREAGSNIRPTVDLVGNYRASDRDYERVANNSVVDDSREDEVLGLGVGARIPTASKRARKYHRGYWEHVINAQQLQRDAELRSVDTQLNEAYLDFKAAQWDKVAKDSTHAYTGEKLRVTRVQALSTPSGGLESASDLFRDFNVSDRQGRFDQLSPISVRQEFLESYAQQWKVEMDLGLRYIKLLREQGIARTAGKALQQHRAEHRDRDRQSLWLWETLNVLSSHDNIDAFIETVKAWDVKRVYVYLGSEAQWLDDTKSRERLTLLLNLCRQQHVEVWALAGEPEWLLQSDVNELDSAIKRIHAFNSSFGKFEPTISGLKVDLEPHSLPQWNTDESQRSTIQAQYIALIHHARNTLSPEIPLWADLSVKFFKDEGLPFFKQVEPYINGATVMTYFDSEEAILKWSYIADSQTKLPLEFGVELSGNAPKTDRVSDWTPERRKAFYTKFLENMHYSQSFAGVALHDYTGLSSITHGDVQ